MIFFLFYNIREEGKIPSVEGCVIEVAREMPVMVLKAQLVILSILQIGGDVDSISRTVTCTGELSALTCVIPRGEGFHTPPSSEKQVVLPPSNWICRDEEGN